MTSAQKKMLCYLTLRLKWKTAFTGMANGGTRACVRGCQGKGLTILFRIKEESVTVKNIIF